MTRLPNCADAAEVPGILLCDRCLHNERAAALEKELIDAALSGDEVEE